MSHNYENPKTKMEALDLMADAYGWALCEQPSVEFEGESYSYSASAGWTKGPHPVTEKHIPSEVVNILFDKLKFWWATQLDCMNAIME
jgi:hypothetical protein